MVLGNIARKVYISYFLLSYFFDHLKNGTESVKSLLHLQHVFEFSAIEKCMKAIRVVGKLSLLFDNDLSLLSP